MCKIVSNVGVLRKNYRNQTITKKVMDFDM